MAEEYGEDWDPSQMMDMMNEMKGMMKGMKGQMKGKGKGKMGDKGGKDASKGKGASKIAAGEYCYSGKVKTWDVEKKRGFICCQEVYNSYGQDVYIHESVLGESGAGPGDTVAFFLHISPSSGNPQASSPCMRICTNDAANPALKGYYKPGPEGSSHGFLTCDATKEFFGRDVYVNKDVATELTQGACVAFNCHLNRDKMPNINNDCQLAEEEWQSTPGDLSESKTDPEVAAERDSWKGGGGGKGGGKDWGKSKGGGDSWGKGGGDSWGKGGGGSWGKGGGGGGMEDMFGMFLDWMGKGKGGGGGSSWGSDDGWGGGKGAKGGKSKGGKDWGGKDGGGGGGKPEPTGETYVGVVKSYNEKNNYGFIACDEITAAYGGDCFFTAYQMCEGCEVGAQVEFDVGINKKGQPQACDIRMQGPAAKRAKLA